MSFLGWFNKFLRYEVFYKSEINLVLRFEKCIVFEVMVRK